MRYLSGKEKEEAEKFMDLAAIVAGGSFCLKAKCGAVIVKNSEVIGYGFNSPQGNKKLEKCLKNELPEGFKSDKTCCIHAEEKAIMLALKKDPWGITLPGSRLYFIRLDEKGEKTFAGRPYCTICSKMALDVGISEFTLWHEEGICVYGTEEYNKISVEYGK